MTVIAIIPAAGIGQRMEQDLPKQYLTLLGKTILELSVQALLADPRIKQVYVGLQQHDRYFPLLPLANDPRIIQVQGGASRAETVTNALIAAAANHADTTLVAVHDAARPGLSAIFLAKLLTVAQQQPEQGALAAVPAWDTMKRKTANGQLTTFDRSELWHAFTPQIFQLGPLLRALQQAAAQGVEITDEASAMELQGINPVLVEAEQHLRKITCPADLIMVQALMLAAQQELTLE